MSTAIKDFTPTQLRTIRNTVAKDTNENEFDLFMNAARSYGLDPFRQQISAIVFSKDKPDRRKMSIIVGRDGLRSIAQRCGDYRPADKPTEYEYDDTLKGPTNPLGLVAARVTLFKQDNKGAWYPVSGEAYWDEFVPVSEEWSYDQEAGKRKPTGKKTVEGNWAKMPRIMLSKCAEAQALRAGWPDVFSGLYAEEEMDQAQAREMRDITPSEAVKKEEEHHRQNLLGNRAILMTLDDTNTFQRVPLGEVADRCLEYIKKNDAAKVADWSVQNREPLRDFWAASPNDALEVKKAIEAKTAKEKVDGN